MDRDATDRARHQQHDLHWVTELAQEGAPSWLLLRLGEGVGPILLQARFRLGGTKAFGGVHLFVLERIADTEGMPDRPCCGRVRLSRRRTHRVSPWPARSAPLGGSAS